jgi:hypothetical protein
MFLQSFETSHRVNGLNIEIMKGYLLLLDQGSCLLQYSPTLLRAMQLQGNALTLNHF